MEEPKLTVISAAPVAGGALPIEELAAPGAVSALGLSAAGNLIVVADDRIFERLAGELTRRSLYAEGSDPTSLGTVSAIIPRAKGGSWLASSNGLFVVDGAYVTHSPVMVGMGPLTGIAEVASGNLNGLWLAATNGVYRRQPAETFRYRVEGYGEKAGGVSADPDGAAAFALLEGALVVLTPGEMAPSAAAPPEEVGTVHALAAAKGTLYAATSKGLYRWQLKSTPRWARFALDGAAALDVQVDPVTAAAWVATEADLVRVDGDTVTKFSRPAGTKLLTVDRLGDLWSAKGASLVRVKTGAASSQVGFESDLKPWLTQHCKTCHADFVDPVAFGPKAEASLQRVRTGDMPRCNGGVPCSSEQWLKPEQYSVLEGWLRGGKQP